MMSLRNGIVKHKPITMASIMDHCTKEIYELKLFLNGYRTKYDIYVTIVTFWMLLLGNK